MQPKSIILFFYGYILFFRRHIGYIDIQENNFFDLKYLGNEDNFDKKLIQKASFALGVGQINLRKKILVKLSKKSCNFITFIHPQSFVSKEAKIGQGV